MKRRESFPLERWFAPVLTLAVIPAALFFADRWNAAISHNLAETFAIVVACGVFMLTWNARKIIDNGYFVFLGVAYLFFGVINVFHMVSFDASFTRAGHPNSIELRFVARVVQSIALVSAPFFISRKPPPWLFFSGFAALSTMLVALAWTGAFPDLYVPGKGMTGAQRSGDHLLAGIQLLSIGTLWRVRGYFDREVFRRLVLSVFFSVAAVLSSDLYTDAYGYNSVIGHYLTVVSFYILYKAIVSTGLLRPYDLLFRKMKQGEEELRAARDGLEARVTSRTEELRAANERLELELAERQRALEMRQLILDLHHLIHSKETVGDFLSSISTFLRERFGFKAIGIRYHRGNDFPYFEARGFPLEFFESENSLCITDREARAGGESCQEMLHECACGAVIAGKFDPALPYFTPFGTFWTNGASGLAGGEGKAVITLGRCVRLGYESIALVPLRFGGVTFGLLQFNDRRKGMLHPHLLDQLERVAENVAAALGRLLTWEALQEIEDRFRTLVENSLVGILIAAGGRIIFHNPQMETFFGEIPEGLPFRNLGLVHPDDAGEFKRLCDAAGDPAPERLETDLRFFVSGVGTERMSIRWIHCHANPIRFNGIDSILVDMVDITRVKELEQSVTARERLASIGQLAAGIAHEIRNPLSGININVSTLELLCRRAGGLEPEERERIDGVIAQTKAASEKISSVIGRVMEFSKPSSPRMDRMDINRIVRNALSLAEMLRRKGRVEFRAAVSPEPLYCQGDPALLEQVVLNLITNAVQAVEGADGEKAITVGTSREGDKAVVRVADTGPGVPEHLREKIFDAFYTTRKEGHGIGLSFSRRIVSDHGGLLSVGAAQGGGAEFRVELPMKEERRPA